MSQDKVHANPGSGIAGLSWDFPGIQGFPGIVPDIRDSSGIINHGVCGSRDPCFRHFRIVLGLSENSGSS